MKRTLETEEAEQVLEGFVGGGFIPAFVTQPSAITVGGLAGVPPGLQDELDKLIRRLKRKQLKRKKLMRPRLDNDRLSRLINAILAVKATIIVGGT